MVEIEIGGGSGGGVELPQERGGGALCVTETVIETVVALDTEMVALETCVEVVEEDITIPHLDLDLTWDRMALPLPTSHLWLAPLVVDFKALHPLVAPQGPVPLFLDAHFWTLLQSPLLEVEDTNLDPVEWVLPPQGVGMVDLNPLMIWDIAEALLLQTLDLLRETVIPTAHLPLEEATLLLVSLRHRDCPCSHLHVIVNVG